MEYNNYKPYIKKIANLDVREQQLRDISLRGLSLGKIQGPSTGYPSIDKPQLKYYSEEMLTKELPNKSIYKFAYDSNRDNMNKIAIDLRSSANDFKQGIKITYKTFFQKVKKVAKALDVLGTQPDEIVPFILPNVAEARYLIYANSYIGSTSYPISPLLPANDLEMIINKNSIKTVFIFGGFYDKYKEVLKNTSIENVIYLDGTESLPLVMKALQKMNSTFGKNKAHNMEIPNDEKILPWNNFVALNKKCNKELLPYYRDDHIAAIIGTSGTTGSSKGVCLTDRNINSVAFSYKNGEYFEGDFLDALLPSIGYGISMIHYQTTAGHYVYLIPELLTDKYPKALEVLHPKNIPGGPVHSINLLNSGLVDSEKFQKPENNISGGATLPKVVEEGLNGVSFGYKEEGINENLIVRQGYGLSENTAMGAYNKRGAYAFGSIGIPIIYENVGVFEPDTDRELQYGEAGEICINSESMMKEYLNNPKETDKVIKIHSDGKRWIHTKDIGYIDCDGHIFHVDRIKNIFMRCGFNVHPTTISEFLNTIPFVSNSVVIGFDHPAEQSVPVGFIQLNQEKVNGMNYDEIKEELMSICYENLEEPSVPYDFVFVDELPINVGGKIDQPLIKKESQIDFYQQDKVLKKEIHFS